MTPAQQRKSLRDQFYAINVDMNKSVKKMFAEVDAESMTQVFGAYMAIISNKDAPDEVPVDSQTLQQMALLAAHSLSRQLVERYK